MLTRRLRYWLDRKQREASLHAEMEAHIEEHAAELIAGGMPESEARNAARRRFGNLGLQHEASRQIWIARYWTDLAQDIRYAVRNIVASPAFSAAAILSAALGIGACSTVFSMVNFAMFRPLPVADPSRLMAINAVDEKRGDAGHSMSYVEIRDIAHQTKAFEAVALYAPLLAAAIRAEGAAPQRHWGFLVGANYFDAVKPSFAAGMGFVTGEDDIPGARAKIVLTHSLWVQRFNADPSIVGRTIQVNGAPATVVGITGPGFQGTEAALPAEFFLPLSQISAMQRLGKDPRRLTSYGSQWLYAVGRLRPGADLRQARTELDTIAQRLRANVPEFARDRGFFTERAGQLLIAMRQIAMPAFYLLLAVTFLVLLTACANVANLMLARASSRTREIATRIAIGAGRGRLIRQLLTESILLALAGGALGVVFALLGGRYFAGLRLPMPLPVDLNLPVDFRVLLFSTALSVFTGVAFGLVPALRATRSSVSVGLRSTVGSIASLRRFGLRNGLVVAQIAISAVLVTCSGLFLRSLDAFQSMDTGMNTRNLLLVRLDPSLAQYTDSQSRRLLLSSIEDAQALPGVRAASVTNLLPLSFGGNNTRIGAEGQTDRTRFHRTAVFAVGPRYFETIGISVVAGTEFNTRPAAEPAVIINQRLAARLYPGQSALGRTITEDTTTARIIGVVADSKAQSIYESSAEPILYRPILDSDPRGAGFGGVTLVIKTAAAPGNLAEWIRQRLASRDPDLVVSVIGTMEEHLRRAMFVPRLAAVLFGLCGGMGLFIATIGVYGVVNFAVARRLREIGIRMALGARSSQVLRMVLGHAIAVAAGGVALGTLGGLALTRAAGSLIYGVSAWDPLTFGAAALILMLTAVAASAAPARRAATVDPSKTLRVE